MSDGSYLQVGQASLVYIMTQLAKMLFLATVFPMSEIEEEEGGHKFDFFNDFLRVGCCVAEIKIHKPILRLLSHFLTSLKVIKYVMFNLRPPWTSPT